MPADLKFTFTATPTADGQAVCVVSTGDMIYACTCAWDYRLTVLSVWLRKASQ